MDIRQLRYFIAIAEAPSLSAAAAVLGVAQPSLSQNVVRMEEELGVRLVERSPRGTVQLPKLISSQVSCRAGANPL
jgi:LysR family nitrogen assimilation transcriptional regulator